MPRSVRLFGWMVTAIVITRAIEVFAASLTFSSTFPGNGGGDRSVSFSGTLEGDAVTGQVVLQGQQLKVVATVAKGIVSGRFETTGTRQVGTFSAMVAGDELTGRYDLNGEVGGWGIPLAKLPLEAREVLRDGAPTPK